MGMASSQARLLMLTSRLHDVELKAQQLQSAKLKLATEEDEIYEEYQRALDATVLTMSVYGSNGVNITEIAATFNNSFSIGAETPAKVSSGTEGYILLDDRGRVVVDDDIYEGYHNFLTYHYKGNGMPDNAYLFAMFMMGEQISGEANYDANNPLPQVFSGLWGRIEELDQDFKDTYGELYEDAKDALIEMGIIGDTNWNVAKLISRAMEYMNGGVWGGETISPANAEQREILETLINTFFIKNQTKIFNYQTEEDGYSQSDFNYYVRIYNAIQAHGGCISINDFDSIDGNAATDSEWLTSMVKSGKMLIERVTFDKDGNAIFSAITVSSDTNFRFTEKSSLDKRALAKAEAKYEHDLEAVNKKDNKIDIELNKLETERNALTKEFESLKKVAGENIDRSFGIFS